MPQKIEGLSYPKTVAELLADRTLTKMMMQTYTSPEVRHRLRFLINPPSVDSVYSEYIAERSRTPISLPRHITQNAADLVMEDNYDPQLWQGIFDLTETNCRTYLEGDIFKNFFNEETCPAFKEHHTHRMVAQAERKFGKSKDVMLRLNQSDLPGIKALLLAMFRRDVDGIKTFSLYISNKSSFKVTPAEVVDAVKNRKGLTPGGTFEIDNKKLSMCGFSKPKDKKVQNRVEDMVSAFMSGDKTTAKQIFQLIQKDEPKGSLLKADTIESLFKAFKKFKVVTG